MKRLGVLGVGVAVMISIMGCVNPSGEPDQIEQRAASSITATDTAATAVAPSDGDGVPPGESDDNPSPCGDEVCEADIPATSGEVLVLLASNPVQFAAVLDTTFPGYDHGVAETLRLQILTAVETTVASAMADAAERGQILREKSETSRELEAVGYFFAHSLLNDQSSPPDAPYLSVRRGLIFGAAVLDELQEISSAQASLIVGLKTARSGDRYLLIQGQWGFGWITDAYRWVKRKLSDGWKWTRNHLRKLRWACIGASVGVVGGCAPCVATALAAPETAGGSLAFAQQSCGVMCVGAVIAAAQACN